VGTLPLTRAGRVLAVLCDFELEDDTLAFVLQVQLSPQLLSGLTLSPGISRIPSFPLPSDASLQVTTKDSVTETPLSVPPRGSAIAVARTHTPEPTQLTLEPVSSSIEGSRWRQHLRLRRLPDDGELSFQVSSTLLDITKAVGVISVAKLLGGSLD
jgi:hypothetical protein